MSKILLTAIEAGGGHKAAMYSMAEAIKRFAPDMQFESWVSQNQDVDRIHRFIYINFPWVYGLVYRLTDKQWFLRIFKLISQLINRKIELELWEKIKDQEYSVIVSTHFMLADALLKLKKQHNLKFQLVSYIPDFDRSLVHFSQYQHTYPNAVMAKSTLLLDRIKPFLHEQPISLHQSGFLTQAAFGQVKSLTRTAAREQLNSNIKLNGKQLNPEKFTIVVTGGSGWTVKIFSAVKALVNSKQLDWSHIQLVVLCGKSNEAWRRYGNLAKLHSDKNIIPLPLLDAAEMALTYRSADLVFLAALAPATMYELIDTDAVPALMLRFNPGQEVANAKYAIEIGLVEYIPEVKNLIKIISKYQQQPALFAQDQQLRRKIVAREQARAQQLAQSDVELLRQLVNTQYSPQ